MRARYIKIVISLTLIIVLVITITSCQISYLTQALTGHMRIMRARQAIEKVLKSADYNQETKDKLQLVLDIHDFAIQELGLPDNESYTLYSELKEEYPGWNVFCAPKLSVEPKTWCFPIAGCVVYHGYFKKEKALEFANKMKKEDLDVYTSPFTAYSTLGWYKDPILSTHMNYDSIRLAGLIIHEMAHQRFYKSGDSNFSESFAVTVERAGVLHWLKTLNQEDQRAKAIKGWKAEDQYVARMLKARNLLSEIYSSNIDSTQMLTQKNTILRALEHDLNIKENRLNNANLIPISTYHSMIPMFQNILDSLNGNFRQFYKEVEQLSK